MGSQRVRHDWATFIHIHSFTLPTVKGLRMKIHMVLNFKKLSRYDKKGRSDLSLPVVKYYTISEITELFSNIYALKHNLLVNDKCIEVV